MMIVENKYIITIFLLFMGNVFAQNIQISDLSFQTQLEESSNDKKIELLISHAQKLRLKNLKESTIYYKYALNLAEKNNHLEQVIHASYGLATNYRMAASYHYALKYFKKQGEAAAALMDTANMGISCHQQGQMQYKQKNYKQAKECYTKAIQYYSSTGANSAMGACYNSIGLLYYNTDYDKAVKYYTKAYLTEKKYGSINNCGIYLNNLACIYIYKQELEKAKVLLDSSMAIGIKNNNTRVVFYASGSYGEYYHAKKQYKKAEEMYLKTIAIQKDNKYIGNVQSIILLLCDLYEEVGDFKSAYLFHKQYQINQDSLNLVNDTKLFHKHEFEREMKQMEFEKDIEILNQKKKESFYQVLLIFSLLLIILVVILISIKKRIEAKKNTLFRENLELKENLLEEKIENKNKELTSKAILLGERNELIKNVSEKLNTCIPKLKKSNIEAIQEVIDDLNSNINEKQWSDYQQNFNELYPIFYKNLLSEFPTLTPTELKLCSFLKLNMSSKKIAQITHMATNSVEVSRSRLRKKLGLSNSNVSFFVFLSRV